MHRALKRIGVEFSRALLAALLLMALTWGGVVVASSVSGGGFSGSIGVATGTRLTLTQGVSAVTGVFSGAVTATAAATAVSASTTTASTYAITAYPSGSGTYGGHFRSGAAGGYAIHGEAFGNGEGVRAVNVGSGRALTVNGDTTAPAVAPLYMAPANNNPAACAVGDLFVCDGNANCGSAVALRLCTATNTWTTVGP